MAGITPPSSIATLLQAAVHKFQSVNYDVQQSHDAVANPLNSVLSFLNKAFGLTQSTTKQQTQNGVNPTSTLKVLLPVTVTGTATASGAVTAPNLVCLSFTMNVPDTGVSANQTNLNFAPEVSCVLPFACSLAYVSGKVVNSALTAGQIAVSAVNTATTTRVTAFTLNPSTTFAYSSFARGALPFSAGDRLTLQYTTNSAYAKTGGSYNLSAWVWL